MWILFDSHLFPVPCAQIVNYLPLIKKTLAWQGNDWYSGRRKRAAPMPGRATIMDDENTIFFSNLASSCSPDRYYFFYIGELKAQGLCRYLEPALTRHSGRPAECISIIPDIMGNYARKNTLALSPLLGRYRAEHGDRVSFRTPLRQFCRTVSTHRAVLNLVEQILDNQEELFIYMFESVPEMTLDTIPGVILLGPDKKLASRLNNKALQFELLNGHVPVVDFRICPSFAAMLKCCRELRSDWDQGIFVSKPYSAAGMASAVTHNENDILRKFDQDRDDTSFLITKFVPHVHDPTVLGVVGNEEDIYIAGVADQRIEGGNRFTGSTWPSCLPDTICAQLYEYTRTIGRIIGQLGYRGIFGCDYVIDEQNRIFFIEINARKQGTTLEFCHALNRILPKETPSLPELEYWAVLQNRIPGNAKEPEPACQPGFCWGTYNHKLAKQGKTHTWLQQQCSEESLFQHVARTGRQPEHDAVMLEHVGKDRVVLAGTFLARSVAVGTSHDRVRTCLDRARQQIQATLSK